MQTCSPVLFADITAEEYTLLSAVLKHGFGESCEEVAIEEKTSAGSVALTTANRPVAEVSEILGINEAMLAKWEKINLEFDYLEERFELPCDYRILSTEKLATVFATADDDSPQTGWLNFKRSFPNLTGVMRLSKPIIDQQTNEAHAYVETGKKAGNVVINVGQSKEAGKKVGRDR